MPESFYATTNPQPRTVGVYAVTRHFGGHEEGGWWFNAHQHIESVPLTYGQRRILAAGSTEGKRCKGGIAHKRLMGVLSGLRARLGKVHEDVVEGDIYSVRGGVQLSVDPEMCPGSEEKGWEPYQ